MLLDELTHLLAQGSRYIGTALGSLGEHITNQEAVLVDHLRP